MKHLLFIIPLIIGCDSTSLQYDPYPEQRNIQCDWIQIYKTPTDDECFVNDSDPNNSWNGACSDLISICSTLNYYIDIDLITCDDKHISTDNLESLHCAIL